MVSLVLEEVTLKSWRGINFENTTGEYKRWSEISPERERESESESDSYGSDLGAAQASYGSALGLAKAQHVEQKPCTDSRSESGSASSA